MSVYAKERADFLDHSMGSIFSQTVPPNDFVLVCDGALTPDLDKVIEKHKEKYPDILQIVRMPENKGLAEALNFGLVHCKYEIVARMDSDDVARPNRMERQLGEFEGVDILGSAVMEFHDTPGDAKTMRITPADFDSILRSAKRRNPFNHPSVMYKKSVVLNAGGYENYSLCEDYHLWVKVFISGGRGKNITEPLVYMRVGSGLYKRRGGLSYFKSMLHFRNWLRKVGFIGTKDFCITVIGHTVSSFMPDFARGILYRKFMRSRVKVI
jgi:glycosyltransferase involved in cell wall biosynthesis